MADSRAAIHFFCDDGSCKPESRSTTFKKPTVVTLIADGTDVTLRFATSPFVSGDKVIQIPADTFVKEKLAAKNGTFKYAVSCGSCSSGNDDAEFIVDL
jgi:hypothetical protein